MLKKLLIVGVGGVGSYLTRALHNYDSNHQLYNLQITIADGDEVDTKNLVYQNFTNDDLMENKARCLGHRYSFIYIDRFLEIPKDVESYDAIISAVDGTMFRKQLFDYVFNKNKKIYWIDLRATGKTVACYSKHKKLTYEYMMSTLPSDDVENGSCQLPFELNSNIIQGGNRIIAEIGAQLILNWYRGTSELSPYKFLYNF